VPDVYAIGDCAEHKTPPGERRPVEQVWYTGRMMGETLAYTICKGKLKYQPGIWFNSAKFLEIEYQTYGWVWAKLKEDEDDFYWEDESGRKCLKLVFDKKEKFLKGCNVFGIRLRHEVMEKWIKDKKHVKEVVEELSEANFDPEFYKKYESEISEKFNSSTVL
jgi:NADPH-dependent 2,4-dienoyl-CoA reductase/sulfur reductase-like enzyme